ncbi:hypothetical protein C7M84_024827 [Penaeus vannamei]|uniref:Uncharacterized protein n=1 Tax=Penaeus vannamei TaxID=6689 RepID=A0A3R7MHN5_PENVA|nr:hypothetical protein C7M84_024827 [Penaeus vannamei]
MARMVTGVAPRAAPRLGRRRRPAEGIGRGGRGWLGCFAGRDGWHCRGRRQRRARILVREGSGRRRWGGPAVMLVKEPSALGRREDEEATADNYAVSPDYSSPSCRQREAPPPWPPARLRLSLRRRVSLRSLVRPRAKSGPRALRAALVPSRFTSPASLAAAFLFRLRSPQRVRSCALPSVPLTACKSSSAASLNLRFGLPLFLLPGRFISSLFFPTRSSPLLLTRPLQPRLSDPAAEPPYMQCPSYSIVILDLCCLVASIEKRNVFSSATSILASVFRSWLGSPLSSRPFLLSFPIPPSPQLCLNFSSTVTTNQYVICKEKPLGTLAVPHSPGFLSSAASAAFAEALFLHSCGILSPSRIRLNGSVSYVTAISAKDFHPSNG